MARIAGMIIGFVFLVIGIIGILTPIPFGIVFLTLSFLLLVPTTPGAARVIRRLRHSSDHFDGLMAAVIRRLPSPYRRILRETEVHVMDRRGY